MKCVPPPVLFCCGGKILSGTSRETVECLYTLYCNQENHTHTHTHTLTSTFPHSELEEAVSLYKVLADDLSGLPTGLKGVEENYIRLDLDCSALLQLKLS